MMDTDVAWADWLRSKRWNFFATGHFAGLISEEGVSKYVQEWLKELDAIRRTTYGRYDEHLIAGKPRVYAAYVIERGPMQGGIHAHMLVGGLGSHPAIQGRARGAWTYGQIHIVRYDPELDPVGSGRSGASAYLRKTPNADIVLVGSLRKWRPRRRQA